MIPEPYFKHLEHLHRELAVEFEKLKAVRKTKNPAHIRQAEMRYVQAVGRLYTSIEEALGNR